MNIPTFTINDFLPVMPVGVLMGGAIVLMLSEVFLTPAKTGSPPNGVAGLQPNRTYMAVLSALTAAVAGAIAMHNAFEPARAVLQGYAVLDPFSSWTTVLVCVATFLASFLSSGFLKHRNAERGEFYALVLFAAAGMSLLALSAEFITLFINLEVLSIATYALTAFLRRGPRPSEAGF
ncbi:MAG: NADH-quinone oxidoreductase subunit N, partial [Archangium sp.]|nr:NADH-quinone oxidoreductase subunit N [Archangium sp.]